MVVSCMGFSRKGSSVQMVLTAVVSQEHLIAMGVAVVRGPRRLPPAASTISCLGHPFADHHEKTSRKRHWAADADAVELPTVAELPK